MRLLTAKTQTTNELDNGTLTRAQAGDETAFRALVERYHVRVYNLVWRMVEQRSGAARVEELVQDVFINVYQALNRFSIGGRAKLSTWILTIATRTALNELRKPSLVLQPGTHLARDKSSPPSPEQELMRRRDVMEVRRAISSLSPGQWAAVVLREYYGLDYKDIADALEIDVGTVKSRLSRARQSLEHSLREVFDE